MSIPEETGKVATSAIDALKTSPGLLVLVLLQVATLALIYFATAHNADLWQARQMALIERCFPQKPATFAQQPPTASPKQDRKVTP